MKKLLNFTEFVNESIGAALGNPVKFTKLKNNAKKYQQVLVQKSLNDVDYEKKKAAAKDDPNKSVEVLKAANKAKNQALADKAAGISDRMDQLATTDGLKAAKSLAKSKAKIAAAETSLKAADAEETKQLKVRIKELGQDVNKSQQALRDFETDSEEKEEEPQQSIETEAEAKAKAEKEAKEKEEAKAKEKEEAEKEAEKETDSETEEETDSDPILNLEADIAAFDKNIETEMATIAKLKKDLNQAKLDISIGRGSDSDVLKIQKGLDDSNEDLSELKKKKADAKKKIDALQKESVVYIGESIADRFRHLMSQRLK
jgi:chromosome segregation ATPase